MRFGSRRLSPDPIKAGRGAGDGGVPAAAVGADGATARNLTQHDGAERRGRGAAKWLGGLLLVSPAQADEIAAGLVASGILDEDSGMLFIGPAAEKRYGRRHFRRVLLGELPDGADFSRRATERLDALRAELAGVEPEVTQRAIQGLKFADLLPDDLARVTLGKRLADRRRTPVAQGGARTCRRRPPVGLPIDRRVGAAPHQDLRIVGPQPDLITHFRCG